MRKVILHYHLFKNAGTSLDAAFKENFPDDKWVTKEFPGNLQENRKLVKEWIISDKNAIVFSSHTAQLPPPDLQEYGIEVLPVVFIRHPIDRMVSAYSFEKKQNGSSFGSVLAKNTSLSGYVDVRLSLPNDRQCRNFHADRLLNIYNDKVYDEANRLLEVVNILPFIGLVEKYEQSIEALEQWLINEGFNVTLVPKKHNVSRASNNTLEEKLNNIREEVGDECFDTWVSVNELDIILYNKVLTFYGDRL